MAHYQTKDGDHLIDLAQQKLMLMLNWERATYVRQEPETFTVKTHEQKNWNCILRLTPEGQDAALDGLQSRMHLLIVLEELDLPSPEKVEGVIRRKEEDSVCILILREQDKRLFPTAVDMIVSLPWRVEEVHRLNRRVHFKLPEAGGKQGPEWALAFKQAEHDTAQLRAYGFVGSGQTT